MTGFWMAVKWDHNWADRMVEQKDRQSAASRESQRAGWKANQWVDTLVFR